VTGRNWIWFAAAAGLFVARWWLALRASLPAPVGWGELVDLGGGPAARQAAGHAVAVVLTAAAVLGTAVPGGLIARWLRFRGAGLAAGLVRIGLGLAVVSPAAFAFGLTGLVHPAVAAPAAALLVAFGLRMSAVPARALRSAWPVALAVLVLLPAAVVPDLEVDSWIFHLAFPAGWVRVHRVVAQSNLALGALWPGREVLSWPGLALGAEPAAVLPSLWFAVLAVAAVVALVRAATGAGAWWVCAAVLASPQVAMVACSAKNDSLAIALVSAGLVALLAGGAGGAAVAGLLAGAAVAAKSTAAVAVPAFLAVALAVRGRPGPWRRAGWLLAAAAGISMPWAARNWLELGNPAAPLLSGMIPTLGWSPVREELAARYVRTWSDLRPASVLGGAAALVRILGGFNLLCGAAVLVLPFSVPSLSRTGRAGLFAGLGVLLWLSSLAWVSRYLLLFLPAMTVAAAALLAARVGVAAVNRWAVASTVLGLVVVTGLRGDTRPVPCALGLESRAHFAARNQGAFGEMTREVAARIAPDARALTVGEWRTDPAGRLLPCAPVDMPALWALAREADSMGRIRVRLRQQRVTHLLFNLPSAAAWADYAARFPWTPDGIARWGGFWDGRATLVWRSAGPDPLYGFFLLFRLSRGPGEAPARGWLPGTEGEFHRLRAIVAGRASDPAADRELDRLTRAFGPRADVLARRGCLLAVRGRYGEALAACHAAARAAPEARPVWSAYGAVATGTAAGLSGYARARPDVVNTGFMLGIPVALPPVY